MAGFLGMTQSQWSAVGELGKGVGGWMSSNAQSKWQSASAKVSELMAVEAQKKAAWEVTRQRLVKRKWIGSARAMFGWAGVDIEGSPMDVLAEANREMTLDEMMTTREGSINEQIYLEEAKWARKAAKASKDSGIMGLIGPAIGVTAAIATLGAAVPAIGGIMGTGAMPAGFFA